MYYLNYSDIEDIKNCGAYEEAVKLFCKDDTNNHYYIKYSRIDYLIDILQHHKAPKYLIKYFNDILELNGDLFI